MRTLHIYSSMLMLLIMLFFTLTGITLNHRDWFSGQGNSSETLLVLPTPFQNSTLWQTDPLTLGVQVRHWLAEQHQVPGSDFRIEWDADDQMLMIDIKRPGGYSTAELSPSSAEVLLFSQDYGAIALLNDLHMGRNAGDIWRWFIDLSAAVMLLFTLTGFWLVLPQKKRRSRLLSISGVGSMLMLLCYWLALAP